MLSAARLGRGLTVCCVLCAPALLLAESVPVGEPDAPPAAKQEGIPDAELAKAVAAIMEKRKAADAKLQWQTGDITIGNGLATLKLGDGYRFLDAKGAQVVIEEMWGNPDGKGTLGMVFPAGMHPRDDGSWGVVLSQESDGHVADSDAASINYDDTLKEMQEDTAEDSKDREAAGGDSVALVGWAEPPHYDAAAHKLHWAKDLQFGEGGEHTLNYDIRVLGRDGLLSLNAVSGMDSMAAVKAGMQELLPRVEFNAGHRYADYNSSTDKLAVYGIAALVAGKLASKAGLLASAGILVLKFKKLLLLATMAFGSVASKLFGKGKKDGDGGTAA